MPLTSVHSSVPRPVLLSMFLFYGVELLFYTYHIISIINKKSSNIIYIYIMCYLLSKCHSTSLVWMPARGLVTHRFQRSSTREDKRKNKFRFPSCSSQHQIHLFCLYCMFVICFVFLLVICFGIWTRMYIMFSLVYCFFIIPLPIKSHHIIS